MMKTLEIGFGPLNKTLKEQLALQDFACDDKSLEKFEKLRNSINMLYIHGYKTIIQKINVLANCLRKFKVN